MVCRMAYELEQLKIKPNFNRNKGLAGADWLISFLAGNINLSVGKSENVSLARARAPTTLNKPGNIFNMDETGYQLNGKLQQGITARGSKYVVNVTSAEKGSALLPAAMPKFGELLNTAWAESANINNAVSGFKTSGIIPLKRKAIPDYACLNEVHQPENGTAVHVKGDIPNSDSGNSDMPTIEAEDNEVENIENNEKLETGKKK
ncbi:hypothetical protein Trydic_g15057 [Trypoxylus dichotomus]